MQYNVMPLLCPVDLCFTIGSYIFYFLCRWVLSVWFMVDSMRHFCGQSWKSRQAVLAQEYRFPLTAPFLSDSRMLSQCHSIPLDSFVGSFKACYNERTVFSIQHTHAHLHTHTHTRQLMKKSGVKCLCFSCHGWIKVFLGLWPDLSSQFFFPVLGTLSHIYWVRDLYTGNLLRKYALGNPIGRQGADSKRRSPAKMVLLKSQLQPDAEEDSGI